MVVFLSRFLCCCILLYFCKLQPFALNKPLKKLDISFLGKLKTKSGAKKRFKLTGTGKIKRKHAFKSHILTKKETKQKRNLTQTGLVDQADVHSVKQQLRLK